VNSEIDPGRVTSFDALTSPLEFPTAAISAQKLPILGKPANGANASLFQDKAFYEND
jgi:hypothetical protein